MHLCREVYKNRMNSLKINSLRLLQSYTLNIKWIILYVILGLKDRFLSLMKEKTSPILCEVFDFFKKYTLSYFDQISINFCVINP
jgi:hypothetical protein